MRKKDLDNLSQPYKTEDDLHRRFNSALGADVPSVGKLANEIFDDLDETLFGIGWWNNMPTEERILVSDQLYQCVNGIETNLLEAKLHYLEWIGAREKSNALIANSIFRDSAGNPDFKYPSSVSPSDDLPKALEDLHLCGFFRAVGSTLDCLGAAIIGVLALPSNLRKADIGNAEIAFKDKKDRNKRNPKLSSLQLEFVDFYETVKQSSGTEHWLEWAEQYRNMYVHRGRRTTFHNIQARSVQLFDAKGQIIPRAELVTHLAKSPDKSDIEAFIKSKDINLNEDAETTLSELFKSCRNFVENISERLHLIWIERRNNPSLLEQPQIQWEKPSKVCNFVGYDSNAQPLNSESGGVNGDLIHRMLSASVFDHQRSFWVNSKWKQ